MKILYPCLLIVLIALHSCSLEKRLYEPGYHVEWRNSAKHLHSNNALAKTEESQRHLESEPIVETETDQPKEYNSAEVLQSQETSSLSSSIKNEVIINDKIQKPIASNTSGKNSTTSVSLSEQTTLASEETLQAPKETASEGAKIEPLAIVSVISALVGLLLWGTIILGPAAAIMGLISLRKIKKDPTKWKGKWIAYLGIGLGLAGITLFVPLLMSA